MPPPPLESLSPDTPIKARLNQVWFMVTSVITVTAIVVWASANLNGDVKENARAIERNGTDDSRNYKEMKTLTDDLKYQVKDLQKQVDALKTDKQDKKK